jgi:hypothetical protein
MKFKAANALVCACLVIILISGCEVKRTSKVTLKDDFKTASKGSTIAEIPNNAEQIRFTLNIELLEGVFNYLLISPSNDTIRNETFTRYGNHKINEFLPLEPGNWKMAYTITNFEDLAPEGSFEMTITY